MAIATRISSGKDRSATVDVDVHRPWGPVHVAQPFGSNRLNWQTIADRQRKAQAHRGAAEHSMAPQWLSTDLLSAMRWEHKTQITRRLERAWRQRL